MDDLGVLLVELIIILLGQLLIFGIPMWFIARYKNRRKTLWIILTIFLGWIALIILCFLPKIPKTEHNPQKIVSK